MTFRDYGLGVGCRALEKTARLGGGNNINIKVPPTRSPKRGKVAVGPKIPIVGNVPLNQQQLQALQQQLDDYAHHLQHVEELREKGHKAAVNALRDQGQLRRTQLSESNDIRNLMKKHGYGEHEYNRFLKNVSENFGAVEKNKALEETIKGGKLLTIKPKHLALGAGGLLVGGAGLYGLNKLLKNRDEYAFLDN